MCKSISSQFLYQTGEKISTIELDTPSLTPEQVQQLETLVNDKIRESLSVYPTLYPDKTALEAEVRQIIVKAILRRWLLLYIDV